MIFKFIADGLDASDISQGQFGDCWFLSALSSLAQPIPEQTQTGALRIKEKVINHVLQTDVNTTDAAKKTGCYRFKFFRLGKWVDVVIDDQLPTRQRAQVF